MVNVIDDAGHGLLPRRQRGEGVLLVAKPSLVAPKLVGLFRNVDRLEGQISAGDDRLSARERGVEITQNSGEKRLLLAHVDRVLLAIEKLDVAENDAALAIGIFGHRADVQHGLDLLEEVGRPGDLDVDIVDADQFLLVRTRKLRRIVLPIDDLERQLGRCRLVRKIKGLRIAVGNGVKDVILPIDGELDFRRSLVIEIAYPGELQNFFRLRQRDRHRGVLGGQILDQPPRPIRLGEVVDRIAPRPVTGFGEGSDVVEVDNIAIAIRVGIIARLEIKNLLARAHDDVRGRNAGRDRIPHRRPGGFFRLERTDDMVDADQLVEIGQAVRSEVIKNNPAARAREGLHLGKTTGQDLEIGGIRADEGDRVRLVQRGEGIGRFGIFHPDRIDRLEQGRVVVGHHAQVDIAEAVAVGVGEKVEQKFLGHRARRDFFADEKLGKEEGSLARLHLHQGGVGQLRVALDERLAAAHRLNVGVAVEIIVRAPGGEILVLQTGEDRVRRVLDEGEAAVIGVGIHLPGQGLILEGIVLLENDGRMAVSERGPGGQLARSGAGLVERVVAHQDDLRGLRNVREIGQRNKGHFLAGKKILDRTLRIEDGQAAGPGPAIFRQRLGRRRQHGNIFRLLENILSIPHEGQRPRAFLPRAHRRHWQSHFKFLVHPGRDVVD